MIDHRIEGASAWRSADIRTEDYRVVLDGPCLDEIRRVADDIRAYPLPTILAQPGRFRHDQLPRRDGRGAAHPPTGVPFRAGRPAAGRGVAVEIRGRGNLLAVFVVDDLPARWRKSSTVR